MNWIRVSDLRPPDTDDDIVTVRADGFKEVFRAGYVRELITDSSERITHWIPLPAVPAENSSEK